MSIIHGHVKMTQLTLIDTLSLTYLLVVYCRLDHEIRLIRTQIHTAIFSQIWWKNTRPIQIPYHGCYTFLKPRVIDVRNIKGVRLV